MKVGILTFHHSDNFGAVLQAFGLQSLLASWGHDVVLLNHDSHRSPAWSRWRDPRGGFTRPVERVRGLIHGGKYHAEFTRFRAESLRLTRFLPDPAALSEATRDLDLILTGSDQVWHFSREPKYFLSWNPPFPGRKIAYAASCGSDQQPEGNCDRIGSWIRSFDFVSVRDDFSARLVRQVLGLNPQVVADPALLVDPSPWVKKPFQAPDGYTLVYHLGPNPAGLAAWLHRFPGGDHPHPCVWVNGQGDRIPKPPPAEIKIWHASPGEWLGWIQGCQALVTDSFHAAIFALHFQKPFVLVTSDRFRSPRLTDLAQRYDLAGHLISRLDLAGPTTLVPPSANTRERVRAHVEQSLGFLRRALAGH